jgi:16S rRNA (guanine(966)-N(2))-methyltransferase RsmD
MRIIGGTHRSRRIHPPQGKDVTRPITDRVKQAMFDRLTAMAVLEGACVDIFSGTGSLGLEALSRGLDHCTFIEKARSSRAALEQNLADLKLTDQATVMGVDALAGSWIGVLPHRPVHLVFCDPPYEMMTDEAAAPRVYALIKLLAGVTDPEAVLVLRTEERVAPQPVDGWEGPATFTYGSMCLHFYQRPETVGS